MAICGATKDAELRPAAENATPAIMPASADQLYSRAGAIAKLVLDGERACDRLPSARAPLSAKPYAVS